MAVLVVGNTNSSIDIDPARNLYVRRGTANFFTGSANFVSGGPSGVVSASIASGTTLLALRHGTTASNDLYITHVTLTVNVSNTGSSGAVSGQLVWERFTSATPTGGTKRTAARADASEAVSQVMDIRDHSGSLTMTGVVKGERLLTFPIPFMLRSQVFDIVLNEDEIIKLQPGNGIAMSTLVTGPGAVTWTYTYTLRWFEGV